MAKKTRSIVSADCKLKKGHIGLPVAYKGVTGLLIRYKCNDNHELMALTMSEFVDCIEQNKSEADNEV